MKHDRRTKNIVFAHFKNFWIIRANPPNCPPPFGTEPDFPTGFFWWSFTVNKTFFSSVSFLVANLSRMFIFYSWTGKNLGTSGRTGRDFLFSDIPKSGPLLTEALCFDSSICSSVLLFSALSKNKYRDFTVGSISLVCSVYIFIYLFFLLSSPALLCFVSFFSLFHIFPKLFFFFKATEPKKVRK